MSKTKIQSVRFILSKGWTSDQARNWLKANDIKPIKRVDKTANELRYRILSPGKFTSFRTIKTDKGINIILGIK